MSHDRRTKGRAEPILSGSDIDTMKRKAANATGLSTEALEMVLALAKANDRDEDGARRAAEQERLEASFRAFSARFAALGIPVRGDFVEDLVRRKFQRTEATQRIGSWMRSSLRLMFLVGPPGTGKTCGAAVAAALYLRDRRTVAYVREHDLIKLAHATSVTAQDRFDALVAADMVIVDECGQTLEEQAERAKIATGLLIDERIQGTKRTICIGNLTTADVVRRYGTRVSDRIREVGVVEELELRAGEKSLRRQVPQGAITEAAGDARRRLLVPGAEDL